MRNIVLNAFMIILCMSGCSSNKACTVTVPVLTGNCRTDLHNLLEFYVAPIELCKRRN